MLKLEAIYLQTQIVYEFLVTEFGEWPGKFDWNILLA